MYEVEENEEEKSEQSKERWIIEKTKELHGRETGYWDGGKRKEEKEEGGREETGNKRWRKYRSSERQLSTVILQKFDKEDENTDYHERRVKENERKWELMKRENLTDDEE